jgi:hypothetical protein
MKKKRRKIGFHCYSFGCLRFTRKTKQVINQQIIYICFRKPGFLFHLCWNYVL